MFRKKKTCWSTLFEKTCSSRKGGLQRARDSDARRQRRRVWRRCVLLWCQRNHSVQSCAQIRGAQTSGSEEPFAPATSRQTSNHHDVCSRRIECHEDCDEYAVERLRSDGGAARRCHASHSRAVHRVRPTLEENFCTRNFLPNLRGGGKHTVNKMFPHHFFLWVCPRMFSLGFFSKKKTKTRR